MNAKIETERLHYIKLHQKELRVGSYDHLKDAVNNGGNLNELGKIVILPSTFKGGNRYVQ